MWSAITRLSLGLFLIALASGVLLLSDMGRRTPSAQAMVPVAVVQHASQAVLDQGVQGMVEGLAERGFVDGKTVAITRFNAENDLPTANAIAKSVSDGRFRLVLTGSTLSLQTVAAANREGKALHVFGLVTDPFGAGVGISRDDPLNHPRHLVGYGTLQPVPEAFRFARQLYPALRTVGVVWNPTEANSEASTKLAREASRELGLTLLEANVENSSGVYEATSSLIARGVQALWVGGDVTVLVALDAVLAAAKKSGIPVFSNVPPNVERGALFGLGADYHEVGRLTGLLAGDVLRGTDPATIPVKNLVPKTLMLNTQALKGLKDPWQISSEVLALADEIVDETGVHKKGGAAPLS
ncbi:MAG: ABC transporter substrate-binding protein [Nitrospirota bacterium]